MLLIFYDFEVFKEDWIVVVINPIEQTEDVGYWHMAHAFVRGNFRNSKTTSPMILQKCCHDFDLIMYLTEEKPVSLTSTGGLRYFNVFGRRQNPEGMYAAVLPKFIKMLLNGEQPTINGDGKQSRDFTYIDNVIEANLKACAAPSEAAGEAFNIAYGGREYLIDIYYGLTKALGVDIEPNFGPDRAGDIKHSNADISKAKNEAQSRYLRIRGTEKNILFLSIYQVICLIGIIFIIRKIMRLRKIAYGLPF